MEGLAGENWETILRQKPFTLKKVAPPRPLNHALGTKATCSRLILGLGAEAGVSEYRGG